jgi:glutamyl-tRNA(Gln) amidotransferase subunit D
MFPELLTIAQIDSKLIRNMWSGDMRFAHHNIMANAVAAEVKKGVKGIIITHGTDTLGYTAAALSFILENCPIPVILVGAQRSSDRGSSDAGINLIAAAQFITETDFAGVAICMHENMDDNNCLILPATKTRKMHSSRRDAFKAINSRPIARVKKDGSVEKISKHAQPKGTFTVKSIEENLKIGLLSFHPNMFAQEIENYSNFDGLILQGTGLGNGPVDVIDNKTKEHDKILKTLIKLAKKIPLVMTTQCLFGRVQMDVYAYGRKLQDAGIIGNHTDMLPETAFIKLAWLLSNHKKDAKKLMTENLRGEISKRIDAEEEFL